MAAANWVCLAFLLSLCLAMSSAHGVALSTMQESVNSSQPSNMSYMSNSTHHHVASDSSSTGRSTIVENGFGTPGDCKGGEDVHDCDCDDDDDNDNNGRNCNDDDNNGSIGVDMISNGCRLVHQCVASVYGERIAKLARKVEKLTKKLEDKGLLVESHAMAPESG